MRLLVIRKARELEVKGRSTIIIKTKNSQIERGIRDIDALLIIGSKVKICSCLPPVLALHGIPLAIMAKDHIAILMDPIKTRYNNYRRLQYQLPKIEALQIALLYIESKINGMINILKYHRVDPPRISPPPSQQLDEETFEQEIRLWEALSSGALWPSLMKLIRSKYLNELEKRYKVYGRKPRNPDPFNKTLSVMYAVLYTLATKALLAAGLDPTYGFLHRTRYSTPLTFDYTEMFKPLAIEAAINMINREGLPLMDFDGELTQEWIRKAIKYLYEYLTLVHKDTRKTMYQQIYLKAFCLAKYLERRCRQDKLTVTWNRSLYRQRKRTKQP